MFTGLFEREDGECYKPADDTENEWIYMQPINCTDKKATHGKWMFFKDYDELNETWKKIVFAIREGKLNCQYAKSSTLIYRPSLYSPGPRTTGLINIYTSKDKMDAIGYDLISIVQQDIRFKTEDSTSKGKYFYKTRVQVTEKILYYNNGEPSLDCTTECPGYSNKKDIWELNIVRCPDSDSEDCYGKWIITFDKNGYLTYFWHTLKEKIEANNFGALKMICPKRRYTMVLSKSVLSKTVFVVYTTRRSWKTVGEILLPVVECDIVYQFNERRRPDFTLHFKKEYKK